MKTTIAVISLLALGASSLLMAGEAESTNTTMTSQPASSYSDGGWFAGVGADYMFDAEEVFFNGHFGYDFGSGSSLFLEAGWISNEDSGFPAAVDVDIVPITIDYKYEFAFSDTFGLYVGAGVGGANVDVSAGFVSGDDWVLAAQAFAGLVFEVTPNFEIYTGLRYLWVDDADVLPANSNGFDDVGIGAGIRFNF